MVKPLKEIREKHLKKAINKINSYRDLEDNWDTYGGVCITEQVAEFAIALLTKITSIPLPRISPISTGVYLNWKEDDIYVEIDEDSVLLSNFDENKFDMNETVEFILRNVK